MYCIFNQQEADVIIICQQISRKATGTYSIVKRFNDAFYSDEFVLYKVFYETKPLESAKRYFIIITTN